MALTVVTAIYGPGYSLHEPENVGPDVRFVCFTDREDLSSRRWEIVCLEMPLSPRRCNRHIKAAVHRYVDGPTLYLDAEFKLVADPRSIVAAALSEQSWAATRHPQRDCLYDEAEFCIEKKCTEDDERLTEQVERYRKAGVPENLGLWAGGILARRGDRESRLLGEAWWEEIKHGSERDQISLPFVGWKLWHMPADIPGVYARLPWLARRKRK